MNPDSHLGRNKIEIIDLSASVSVAAPWMALSRALVAQAETDASVADDCIDRFSRVCIGYTK